MWWLKYIGLPFLELGRDKSGCDCWGLVRIVYEEELGIALPSWSAHKTLNDRALVRDELEEAHKLFQKIESPEPFSLVLASSSVTVLHVGIATEDGRMLHTTKGKDACIERWSVFEKQLKGFYRYHDQSRCPS
jgi:cell wall-associated NlpC family hydrolase